MNQDQGPILVVGELNPHGSDPRYALLDRPDGSAGHRLRTIIFGLHRRTYLRMDRRNLCDSRWSAAEAKRAADHIADPVVPRRYPVILLGRKVASAFGFGHLPFFSVHPPVPQARELLDLPVELPFQLDGLRQRYLLLPHPSGLCREWHAPGAIPRARELLREWYPAIPWGEADIK